MQYVISTQKTISCFVVSITNCLLVRLLVLFSVFFTLNYLALFAHDFFCASLIGPDLSADQFIENQKSSILFESISLGIIAFKASLTTLLLSVSGNTKWVFVWWFLLFFMRIHRSSWIFMIWSKFLLNFGSCYSMPLNHTWFQLLFLLLLRWTHCKSVNKAKLINFESKLIT